jgi:predicted transposase YdaD
METSALKKYETKWFEDGKVEGEQIGIAKGEQKLKDTARRMLIRGMTIQEVSELTGLTVEVVKPLNKDTQSV